MAFQSVAQSAQSPQTYSIKEFQLLVKDSPVVPAEIQPFVGIQFHSSLDVYQAFRHLSDLPVETFLILHLDTKNRIPVSFTTILKTSRHISRLTHSTLSFQTAW